MKRLRTLQLADRTLEQFQSNVADSLDSVIQHPLLSGKVHECTVTVAEDCAINHQLAKAYQGFWVVHALADVRIWESSTTNPHKDRQLIIRGSASGVIKVFVY
jgi:hypothetical protein